MDSEKLAALRIKLKEMREAEVIAKKARSTIFCPNMKPISNAERGIICQATNMNGNKCSFRATCGKYCRRHKIL